MTPSGRVVVAGTDRAFYVMQGAGRPKTAVRLPHEHVTKIRVNDDLFVISLRSGQDYVVDVGSPLSKNLGARAAGLVSRRSLLPIVDGAVSRVANAAAKARSHWWSPAAAQVLPQPGVRRRRALPAPAPAASGFELEALPPADGGSERADAPARRRRSRSAASRRH